MILGRTRALLRGIIWDGYLSEFLAVGFGGGAGFLRALGLAGGAGER